MNKRPIGVLDSGVGGLSIWREIVKLLPCESTIYIADSKNCPYGSKSSDEIYHLAKRLVQFLLDQKAKLIVLACNTITVSCLDSLRKEYPKIPIIGTVPVIKTAAEKTKIKRIGILSTERTAKSSYQKNLIKRFASDYFVLNHGTNNLVPFVEKGEVSGARIEKVLQKELKPFIDANIDVLALGCSHFPFLKPLMQEILGKKVTILDSGEAIARQVRRILEANSLLAQNTNVAHMLYTTGEKRQFIKTMKRLIGYNKQCRIASIQV